MTAPNSETSTNVKQAGDRGPDGLQIGYSATDKVGAFGTTPAIQPTSASQAAVTMADISAVTTVAIAPVTTTGSTTATPYGFTTSAQADAIVTATNNIITRQALIITAVNSLITRQALGTTLMNALRSALVTLGWIKGS
jgi:hypothetical protein